MGEALFGSALLAWLSGVAMVAFGVALGLGIARVAREVWVVCASVWEWLWR